MKRTALVTGAAGELGALAARRLAAAAWDVVALDTDGPGLARTALRSPNMHVRTCDVTDPEAIAGVLAMAGPVHRVVHTAVIAPGAPGAPALALEQPPTEVERVLHTDALGTVHVVRATLPGMLERGAGELILCAAPPAAGAPAAAAGSVAAYADALWKEHGGRGVTFRCADADAGTPPRLVLDAVDRSLARPAAAVRVHPARGRPMTRLLPARMSAPR